MDYRAAPSLPPAGPNEQVAQPGGRVDLTGVLLITRQSLEKLVREGHLAPLTAQLLQEGMNALDRERGLRHHYPIPVRATRKAPSRGLRARGFWGTEGLPPEVWAAVSDAWEGQSVGPLRLVCRAWARDLPRAQSRGAINMDLAVAGVGRRFADMWPSITSLKMLAAAPVPMLHAEEVLQAVQGHKLEALEMASSAHSLLPLLGSLTALTTLRIGLWEGGSSPEDVAGPWLQQLTMLRTLKLGEGFTPVVHACLLGLTGLVSLDLSEATPAVPTRLPELPMLEHLSCPPRLAKIPEGLWALPRLKSLRLEDIEGFVGLGDLGSLEDLELICNIRADNLDELKRLPRLQELTFRCTQYSEEEIEAVASCTGLRRLFFDGPGFDCESLHVLHTLTRLEEVKLPKLVDLDLAWLPSTLARLTVPQIAWHFNTLHDQVYGEKLVLPGGLTHLELEFEETHGAVEYGVMDRLPELCPLLESLELSTNVPLGRREMLGMAARLPKLTRLVIEIPEPLLDVAAHVKELRKHVRDVAIEVYTPV